MSFKSYIRDVSDFPIPGVIFRDISPLLENPHVLSEALQAMVEKIDLAKVDHIVGVESRGFILGAALAQKAGKGFIPLRKAGKLPPPVHALSYDLEYGSARLEMRAGQGRILLVDDVLATGGTLKASIALCEMSGYHIEAVSVLIDLRFLNKFEFRGAPVHSAVMYE